MAVFNWIGYWTYRHLQNRGSKVILFTPNDTDEFEEVYERFNSGRRHRVDGVLTDRPTELKAFFDNHGKGRRSKSAKATKGRKMGHGDNELTVFIV